MHKIKQAAIGIKEKFTKTRAEGLLLEATTNDSIPCFNSVLSEIADCSFRDQDFEILCKQMWARLDAPEKEWRRIHKTLVVIDYLLKYGSGRIVNEIRDNSHKIRWLATYPNPDAAAVREMAHAVSSLLADYRTLDLERSKARDIRKKFEGISSGEQSGGFNESKTFHSAVPTGHSNNAFRYQPTGPSGQMQGDDQYDIFSANTQAPRIDYFAGSTNRAETEYAPPVGYAEYNAFPQETGGWERQPSRTDQGRSSQAQPVQRHPDLELFSAPQPPTQDLIVGNYQQPTYQNPQAQAPAPKQPIDLFGPGMQVKPQNSPQRVTPPTQQSAPNLFDVPPSRPKPPQNAIFSGMQVKQNSSEPFFQGVQPKPAPQPPVNTAPPDLFANPAPPQAQQKPQQDMFANLSTKTHQQTPAQNYSNIPADVFQQAPVQNPQNGQSKKQVPNITSDMYAKNTSYSQVQNDPFAALTMPQQNQFQHHIGHQQHPQFNVNQQHPQFNVNQQNPQFNVNQQHPQFNANQQTAYHMPRFAGTIGSGPSLQQLQVSPSLIERPRPEPEPPKRDPADFEASILNNLF